MVKELFEQKKDLKALDYKLTIQNTKIDEIQLKTNKPLKPLMSGNQKFRTISQKKIKTNEDDFEMMQASPR